MVSRRTPPLAICGCDGEPSVKIWQVGGGVELFAHTLLVVKLPVGKLKDWAEALPIAATEIKATANAQHSPILPRIISPFRVSRKTSEENPKGFESGSGTSTAGKNSSSASWLSLGEEKPKLVAGNCLG